MAWLQTAVLLSIALVIFVTTRHIQITTFRRAFTLRPRKETANGRDGFFFFVLGSGGHTREMLMMMDDGSCDFAGLHRRYLVSSGDSMSENHLLDYERDLTSLCAARGTSPGTFDVRTVTRARRVHQPLWSTPWTALRSIVDIFPVLLSPPSKPGMASASPKRTSGSLYPSRIYSNGPATGFFVGLAAHLLKMFYLVPGDSLAVIYIESWARISTLSLTGKLFRYTGIADVMLVQHKGVAEHYGIQNAGEMVFNARRPDS